MAALIRRRLGNFTKSFHSLNLTLKSFSTQQQSELQSLVDNFKKSCEDKKFRYRKNAYLGHVRRLAYAKQFDMIEESLDHQKNFPDIRSEGFAIRLIDLYGESGMFEHARKLFDELPALNCPRTVKSFSALLKSGVKAKELHKVIELFNDLPSAISVQPDIFCHNIVIHALCEMGRIEEALLKFRELGKDANIVTYNTILSALYKCDRFSDAEKLWAEMEASVKPDARCYRIRIKAMFQKKKVDEALLLGAEMANKGIEYDEYTYNTLIIGLCGNGNLKEAKKWYDDLQKSKCRRSLVATYLAIIPACCEAGDLDKVFEICSDSVKHKMPLNSTLCQQVFDAFIENGRTEKASELKNLLKPLEEQYL